MAKAFPLPTVQLVEKAERALRAGELTDLPVDLSESLADVLERLIVDKPEPLPAHDELRVLALAVLAAAHAPAVKA